MQVCEKVCAGVEFFWTSTTISVGCFACVACHALLILLIQNHHALSREMECERGCKEW